MSPVHPGDQATATPMRPGRHQRPPRGYRRDGGHAGAEQDGQREQDQGHARSVERRASPAVVSDMNALINELMPVGS